MRKAKTPQKMTVKKTLFRFYTIYRCDNKGNMEKTDLDYPPDEDFSIPTDKREYTYQYEDNDDDENYGFTNDSIDLGKCLKIFVEIFEKHSVHFDRIFLNYDVNYGYVNYFRIVGERMETDEEFAQRIKDLEEKQKAKELAKEKKKADILERKRKKLEQLKQELGVMN